MHKKYILPVFVFILALTAFSLNKREKSIPPTNVIKASFIKSDKVKKVVSKKAEKAELTEMEKAAAFESYANNFYAQLNGKKPSVEVFKKALQAFVILEKEGPVAKNLLTVIDFSLPSTEKRLWVIDLENKKVIENLVVSHGKNSGMNKAKSFSNVPNSFQSSLGAYVTGETYTGKHGLSLRLDGVEKGINDNARNRAIVIHTAAYANPSVIKLQGRLGRSLGCPAIQEDKLEVINYISGGSVLYIYGNDKRYASTSRFNDLNAVYAAVQNEMKI